jgi:xanthine dehydrogenase small subunit
LIRFLHGDREVTLQDARADTTVLEYLRSACALTGTKEGCASGDCGACTVVQVSADDAGLRYAPVNACIATLGSLHGKQLLTVEDLARNGELHPVQKAMVDCHGSQCGFCTPGFVMSLFALYQREGDVDRAQILEALGGNLCRCTGYRPIIAAAEQALEQRDRDGADPQHGSTARRLRTLNDTLNENPAEAAALSHGASHYYRPYSSARVCALLSEHESARLIAGGTDLMLEYTQGLQPLDVLIDLRAVPELQVLCADDKGIVIGAAVSHQEAQALLLADYPELAELIERFGSLQIRTQGTVVGNLANASPIGDWPPTFLALGADLELESARGRRRLKLSEFFLDYRRTALAQDEFIRSVRIPRRPESLFLRAYKISKRFEDDISSVCGVFALRLDDSRVVDAQVAFGGMAAVPAPARACAAALCGLDLQRDALHSAADALETDFQPISDARASAAYRSVAARRLIDRLQADYRGEATRVHVHTELGAAHG